MMFKLHFQISNHFNKLLRSLADKNSCLHENRWMDSSKTLWPQCLTSEGIKYMTYPTNKKQPWDEKLFEAYI